LITVVFVSSDSSFSADYVGSEKCFKCHKEQFNDWQASGHPWKLRKAEKARYAKIPLPPGYSWEDISYVIGGVNKKALYIDLEGYIITSAKDGTEARTQYNIQDGSWSFYYKGEKRPYKCGPCHMTAFSPEGRQDGRPGMIGTWTEDGIGCEECHGPGSDHIQSQDKQNITVNRSVVLCGKCHQSGGNVLQPQAKGGFIRHHEQINELLAGSHIGMDCVLCHDPHKRAILAKIKCDICHEDIAKHFSSNVHAKTGMGCIECHMPKISKSAITVNSYTGDVRTHIFRINTNPDADMFKTIEEKGKKSTFAKGFVTLDYVCLGCHGSRDIKWASKNAKKFHKK
jgi:hypothetical protein